MWDHLAGAVKYLGGGVIGGIISPLMLQFLNRKRNRAEIEKIRLDADKTRLEIESLRRSMDAAVASVLQQGDPETIIYDSRDGFSPTDFHIWGDDLWPPTDPAGIKGVFRADFPSDDLIVLYRLNRGGRVRLRLAKYAVSGELRDVLPGQVGGRHLRLRFQAKVSADGPHQITVQIKRKPDGFAVKSESLGVSRTDWMRFNRDYYVAAAEDLELYLDDHSLAAEQSTLFLRGISLSEVIARED